MKHRSIKDQIKSNLVGVCLTGSRAYGTHYDSSDWDYRGIFVADPEYHRTPFWHVSEVVDDEYEDFRYYELNKLVKLATECNPNILELIFCSDDLVITDTEEYKLLRSMAPKLITKQVVQSYVGYATAQMKRLRDRRVVLGRTLTGSQKIVNNITSGKWPLSVLNLLQPDMADIIRELLAPLTYVNNENAVVDMSLWQDSDTVIFTTGPRRIAHLQTNDRNIFSPGFILVKKTGQPNQFDVYYTSNPDDAISTRTGELRICDTVTTTVRTIPVLVGTAAFNANQYTNMLKLYDQYHESRKRRNETRFELESSFGYDTKHALHLMRLMTSGIELITTGNLTVQHPRADFLKSIKEGKLTFEELQEQFEELKTYISSDKVIASSPLPDVIDVKVPTNLIMQIQDSIWSRT